jgi:LEA14-like dessication related protein
MFIAIVLSSCSRIDPPEFRGIESFKVLSLGLDQVKISFGITYYNPNDFTVAVKETGADVYLDGVLLGRFAQDSAIQVGRRAPFTVQLGGTIPVTTFFQLDMREIHRREVLVRATGTTRVGKAGLYITRPIDYEGRHRLDQIRF